MSYGYVKSKKMQKMKPSTENNKQFIIKAVSEQKLQGIIIA